MDEMKIYASQTNNQEDARQKNSVSHFLDNIFQEVLSFGSLACRHISFLYMTVRFS
jgi:hypothetical protein